MEITQSDLNEMVEAIERGAAEFVRDGFLGTKVLAVPWNGARIPVVYAPSLRTIFTILDERALPSPPSQEE